MFTGSALHRSYLKGDTNGWTSIQLGRKYCETVIFVPHFHPSRSLKRRIAVSLKKKKAPELLRKLWEPCLSEPSALTKTIPMA